MNDKCQYCGADICSECGVCLVDDEIGWCWDCHDAAIQDDLEAEALSDEPERK